MPTLSLYGHPFSSYTQKVLIALYENATPFDFRTIAPEFPAIAQDWLARWPMAQFPVLVDDGETIAESSIIIEHLHLRHPGPVRLLPDAPGEALAVRFLDRVFDMHVMSAMQNAVGAALTGDRARLEEGLALARARLDRVYGWLDTELAGRTWAACETFTLADCAAAPALFYADWVHPIPDDLATLRAYRARLLARPSFARAVDEARPYRPNFPLGAPDRD
ncbi:MAG: glutathione S-transferase family protein [Alphaproteobacteria bacterium]|nr:glutathione S-transferase family protein [Alphaproteobacteria bacterium]